MIKTATRKRPKSASTFIRVTSAQNQSTRPRQGLINGLSINQWKAVTSFQIGGQSNKKKVNFNLAINHYFNLKSMYKKINQINEKPSVYSQKAEKKVFHSQINLQPVNPTKENQRQQAVQRVQEKLEPKIEKIITKKVAKPKKKIKAQLAAKENIKKPAKTKKN